MSDAAWWEPHDDENRRLLMEQREARMLQRCSVCETPTSTYELDSSSRCRECQP